MKLIEPGAKLLWATPNPLGAIESAGRTCYKSEDKITIDSAINFVRKLMDRGHWAMIEHASMSFRVICDRGVTHEIVRHRLFSYAQESTRYCNYSGGVTFIIPPWYTIPEGEYNSIYEYAQEGSIMAKWLECLSVCEKTYIELLQYNWSPQQARSVLPNSLKTEIVITGNLREWHHFFKLRLAKTAHPQMREVAKIIFDKAKQFIPVVFDDLEK